MNFIFHFIYGMSSFPLTNINQIMNYVCFSDCLRCPTHEQTANVRRQSLYNALGAPVELLKRCELEVCRWPFMVAFF